MEAQAQPKPDAIRIDCRGVKIDCPILEVNYNGQLWQFVIDPQFRQQTTFHAGLFINLEAASTDSLRYPPSQRFCALFESPINACYAELELLKKRFHTIFTHQESLLVQGQPFLPLMFGTNWIGVWTDQHLQDFLNHHPVKTANVSFLGSIQHASKGAYSFRREVAELSMSNNAIECFGKGIREIAGKGEALEQFRFSIAMENAASNFYFSEKLIDCFLMETVPIYFGCPGIETFFDPRGMLTFNTIEELRGLLPLATTEKYEQMRPYVLENKVKSIQNNWHTHPALFHRLTQLLADRWMDPSPISLRDSMWTKTSRKVRALLGSI